MQQLDDDWDDDFDEYAIEQCVLKEHEILSQNPQLQQNFSEQEYVTKENSNHWINGRFNSFNEKQPNASKTEFANISKTNQFKKSSSFGSFSKPTTAAPKKQTFYKPVITETSISLSLASTNDAFSNKGEKEKNDKKLDSLSLQKQLQQVLQEKAKLEEENLIKQGEVYNLRCELKKKETSLETERVDQCIALDAAEKRGKDKAAKTVVELESKVKSLEREVDRLEGNILFKNREVEELLARCKQSEPQSSAALHKGPRADHSSPSPKKRKLEDRFSPNKTSFNFADKFDFGDKKKIVKSVQIQTESEVQEKRRVAIQISSGKGHISGSRKAFYILNILSKEEKYLSRLADGAASPAYALLGQMISSEDHLSSNADNAEHLLLKHACRSLENLLKATQNENASSRRAGIASGHDKQEENLFLEASIPLVKILSVAKSENETVIQNCIRILTLFLDHFLKDNNKNNSRGIVSILDALSRLLNHCSDLSQELCNNVIESLKRCCESSCIDVANKLLSLINSLCNFEIFRRKICANIAGQCLLKKFSTLLKNTKIHTRPNVVCNDLARLVSQLLHDEPNALTRTCNCNCSSPLLSVFVNTLYCSCRLALKDMQWQWVLNGLKVLHTWQRNDRTWLEKTSTLTSYSLLLSAVTGKAKFLKSKGILDQHTWELVYDFYETDATS